ncbi:hypothetical protein ScPMuIL_000351 [Solemya velum]
MDRRNSMCGVEKITSPIADIRRSPMGRVRLQFCPTTGGHIELSVPFQETIQGLKWTISRKLRIPPERINLLFRERILKNGTLQENSIVNNSRITILPNMESGIAFHRPDSGVMQALESLTESQDTNWKLTGRSPLVLAMKLGDHMMFIQLQLSTSQCGARRHRPAFPSHAKPSQQHHGLGGTSMMNASQKFSQRIQDLTKISKAPEPVKPSPVCPAQSVAAPVPVPSPAQSPGAVIDSMHHLGHGVYSGTFSGTLDPSLQDSDGKPKKDISTIVRILNDLLGASPHQRQAGLVPRQQNMHKDFMQKTERGTSRTNNGPGNDNNALRGKVRQLQMMMEERRMRRRAKRESKAPYPWSGNRVRCSRQADASQATGLNLSNNLPEPQAGSYGSSATVEQETIAV